MKVLSAIRPDSRRVEISFDFQPIATGRIPLLSIRSGQKSIRPALIFIAQAAKDVKI